MPASWMRKRYKLMLCAVLLLTLSLSFLSTDEPGQAAGNPSELLCQTKGWSPVNFGLKDHHVFLYNNQSYLVSTYIPGESAFAYGRSTDLCHWDELPVVLPDRTAGEWDEYAVWAPFVYEEGGVYYMFYTGVTNSITQSIMLATSQNPDDPDAWQRQGMVFQPDHPGMVWNAGTWSDCRDPMLTKIGELYYLFYTGRDTGGGIIGLATANSLAGPWMDWGAVMTDPDAVPESPTITTFDGLYYLFFNRSFKGEEYLIGATPAGPWRGPYSLKPGWAHEFWVGQDGLAYASFLTDLTVTILPTGWDHYHSPARPFLGEPWNHILLPIILHFP